MKPNTRSYFEFAIPKELKNNPIGVKFHKNGYDILITQSLMCKKCDCLLPKESLDCSRCRHKKLDVVYSINKCQYTYNCPVNGWGCNIHSTEIKHPFTCICDDCQ